MSRPEATIDHGQAASAPAIPPRDGILPVDKPAGWTSHDVVARMRRALGTRAIGHLGTLDPDATGLLLLVVGAATRCAPVWTGGEKTYLASLRFGIVTDTQDTSGRVLERRDIDLDPARVRAAALPLLGDGAQVPPMVSAVHAQGERLHRLARRGIIVERPARPIRVVAWEWLEFDLPRATFQVRCSSGTYVRTLAHDLGQALGVGAALESLRRLRSEPFGLERALPWEALEDLAPEALWHRHGIDLSAALEVLPAVTLADDAARAIGCGAPVEIESAAVGPAAPIDGGARSVALRDRSGRPIALGELRRDPVRGDTIRACPRVVFPWAVRGGAPA